MWNLANSKKGVDLIGLSLWEETMKDNLEIIKVEYLSNLSLDRIKQNLSGRQPQPKNGISQYPLLVSSSNLNIKFKGEI